MKASSFEDRSVALACQRVSEWIFYGCVAIAPWAFGCVGATPEFLLTAGVSMALLAYGVGSLADGPVRWNGRLPSILVMLGLLGLAAVAAIHQWILPAGLIQVLAPGVSEWTQWDLQEVLSVSWLPRWDVGQRLSLYPAGSFQVMFRVLLLVGIFVVVQNFRSPRACLHRLSLVAAITGTMLALFGLAQHFGSHDGLTYWTYDMEGGLGFGPFVNRNHYPFFLNLCLGLTIGLLVERLSVMGRHWYRLLLTDPTVGWLLVAISFMFASLIACGSRGGVLSIVAGVSIVMLLRLRASNASRGVMMTGLVAVPTVLVLIWVGFDFRESRLNMLAEADRYAEDGRFHLWASALQSVPDFPWLGSGGETYRYWDNVYQSGDPEWNNWKLRSLRADNEFLDVLCEYGVFGLLALILLIGPALWLSVTQCRRDGLSAGAAMGIIAVVAHSGVDFGLRVPATAVLAMVVLGLLSGVGTQSGGARQRLRESPQRSKSSFSRKTVWGGIAGVGMILIAIGAIQFRSRYFYSDRSKVAAFDALILERPEAAFELASAAVALTPEDIDIRLEFAMICEFMLDPSRDSSLQSKLRAAMVRNSLEALQVCPLAWQPYAWLAKYGRATDLQTASGNVPVPENWRTLCLLRARQLHPSEPELAYITGERLLNEIGLDAALPHWRDSLTYSRHRMDDILEKVEGQLDAEQMKTRLIPDDPVVIFAASSKLDNEEDKRLFLDHALELLEFPERSKRELTFGEREDWRSKVFEALDQPEKALRALDRSLNEFPENIGMRLRRVKLLMKVGKLDQATSEVRILLTLSPDNGQVKALQKQLSERKAREL
ncbi:O-antigen ligase-like protein [Rhodopirellula islandica]|uniref:O-antigen ligase-like protein n=1 Tax=Rhodopirellula islandica TaxID=595434 RepID=A0A0J1BJG5_RHOIS|nr:O-antigen ligase family protein [Rhodopirellula islandica]KLU06662.1 O-antigen ligase-like protein [Rhodopirellula islandica]